jgi:dihydroorotate dehydrogenase (fumarate)
MDLATRYLGLTLRHPIVASASPLTASLDGMRRLEDAGAAAVVMASLYEEQIRADDTTYALRTEAGSYSQAEAGSYFPEMPDYRWGVSGHLETLRRASEALDIPVIASLNGTTHEGWIEYATLLEQAGAAALELNLFIVPAQLGMSGREVEARHIDIVREVTSKVRIPVSIKLSPFFSSIGHLAAELERVGAKGFVLFNRFLQPDIDLDTLRLKLDLQLSTPADIHLTIMWIALLSQQLQASLAAGRGVDSHEQVVKCLLVGADAVMTTSALLRHGPGHLGTMISGLVRWLEEHQYASVASVKAFKDASFPANVAARLRTQYVKALTEYVSDPTWRPKDLGP